MSTHEARFVVETWRAILSTRLSEPLNPQLGRRVGQALAPAATLTPSREKHRTNYKVRKLRPLLRLTLCSLCQLRASVQASFFGAKLSKLGGS